MVATAGGKLRSGCSDFVASTALKALRTLRDAPQELQILNGEKRGNRHSGYCRVKVNDRRAPRMRGQHDGNHCGDCGDEQAAARPAEQFRAIVGTNGRTSMCVRQLPQDGQAIAILGRLAQRHFRAIVSFGVIFD
jgi:hypothetical protein